MERVGLLEDMYPPFLLVDLFRECIILNRDLFAIKYCGYHYFVI